VEGLISLGPFFSFIEGKLMNPTTKLEAVNTLLATIGESPVNSLTSGLVEASLAEQTLDNVSRDVQSMGWAFNTDLKFNLTPNASNEIALPANCLHVDTTALRMSSESDLVQRGMRLYDRIKNTYTITDTIEVDIVVLLSFDEMPEAARRYATIRAARILQDRVLGSESLHSFNAADEQSAWVALSHNESDVKDLNIFDNYDTYSIINRWG
jgi:hypothetical protein